MLSRYFESDQLLDPMFALLKSQQSNESLQNEVKFFFVCAATQPSLKMRKHNGCYLYFDKLIAVESSVLAAVMEKCKFCPGKRNDTMNIPEQNKFLAIIMLRMQRCLIVHHDRYCLLMIPCSGLNRRSLAIIYFSHCHTVHIELYIYIFFFIWIQFLY